MPGFRILRCANAHLYLGASLLVLGAAAYVLCCKDETWQHLTAILAAVCTPLWAAYYIALRYTVNETGITRRGICGTTTLNWAELTSATCTETHNQGTASCTIDLEFGNRKMRISSDLLPLEEVQELAKDLRDSKLLF